MIKINNITYNISIHTLHAEGDGKYDEKIAMVF